MAHKTGSLVKELSTTTGTGTYALGGAVTGHRAFSAICANGDTVFYCAREVDGSGNPSGGWEIGLGTWSTGNNLARTTILKSSNSDAAVSWSAGTRHVYVTLPGEMEAGLRDNNALRLPDVGTIVTPAAGSLDIFSRVFAERRMLAQADPNGRMTALQPLLARNRIGIITANGNSTATATFAIGASATGTSTARNVASTDMNTQVRRIGFVSNTTAGSSCGTRTPALQFLRGDAAKLGGFFFACRFMVSDAATVSNSRLAVGLFSTSSAIGNVNPSTLTHFVAVAADAGDANLSIMHNDGSGTATVISLGSSFPAQTLSADFYEVIFFCVANASEVYYRVERLNTGDVATGTLSSDLPGSTTLLSAQVWRNNGSTALAVGIDLGNLYIETDF